MSLHHKILRIVGIWGICATAMGVMGFFLPMAMFWFIDTFGIIMYIVLFSLPAAISIYHLIQDSPE